MAKRPAAAEEGSTGQPKEEARAEAKCNKKTKAEPVASLDDWFDEGAHLDDARDEMGEGEEEEEGGGVEEHALKSNNSLGAQKLL